MNLVIFVNYRNHFWLRRVNDIAEHVSLIPQSYLYMQISLQNWNFTKCRICRWVRNTKKRGSKISWHFPFHVPITFCKSMEFNIMESMKTTKPIETPVLLIILPAIWLQQNSSALQYSTKLTYTVYIYLNLKPYKNSKNYQTMLYLSTWDWSLGLDSQPVINEKVWSL